MFEKKFAILNDLLQNATIFFLCQFRNTDHDWPHTLLLQFATWAEEPGITPVRISWSKILPTESRDRIKVFPLSDQTRKSRFKRHYSHSMHIFFPPVLKMSRWNDISNAWRFESSISRSIEHCLRYFAPFPPGGLFDLIDFYSVGQKRSKNKRAPVNTNCVKGSETAFAQQHSFPINLADVDRNWV